jgi:ubiquitin carboxyl-terminal hydrolase 4/11/15
MHIWTAPQCLIIHLKRFTADRKIDAAIDCPEVLDMKRFVMGPQKAKGMLKYRLCAVAEHFGSISGGHYTAHAKVGEKWYLFDDAVVRPVDIAAARNQNAYLLHYERINR